MSDEEIQVKPSWKGFVATTFDAALIVQAAITRHPEVYIFDNSPGSEALRTHIQSGWVFVYRVGAPASNIRRWRDGLQWTDRRNLGRGLGIYRQVVPVNADSAMSEEELVFSSSEYERQHQEIFEPYLGQHTGCTGVKKGGEIIMKAKRHGLLKKSIFFTVNGQKYGLAAYFTLADGLAGTLPRPRHSPRWIPVLLSPDFWASPPNGNGAWAVELANDNGHASSADAHGWRNALEVLPPNAANSNNLSSPNDTDPSGNDESEADDYDVESGADNMGLTDVNNAAPYPVWQPTPADLAELSRAAQRAVLLAQHEAEAADEELRHK
ncbi:hypothetical protein VTJ49DRAFT_5784 [Mycothermus thermophilus]|uniref:Uncharacterized protein n=1 Tax=Humicola insolens TaxID=85995 RepID=A0ABR3VQT8_HUMIN